MAEDMCGVHRVQAEGQLKRKAVGGPIRRDVGVLLTEGLNFGLEAGRSFTSRMGKIRYVFRKGMVAEKAIQEDETWRGGVELGPGGRTEHDPN